MEKYLNVIRKSGKMVGLGSQWVCLIRNIIRFLELPFILAESALVKGKLGKRGKRNPLTKLERICFPYYHLVFAKLLGSRKTKAFRR